MLRSKQALQFLLLTWTECLQNVKVLSVGITAPVSTAYLHEAACMQPFCNGIRCCQEYVYTETIITDEPKPKGTPVNSQKL